MVAVLATSAFVCQRVVVAATLPSYGLRSVENLVDKHFAAAAGDGKKSGRKPGAKDKTSAK